jgi:hypothetical protein
MLVSVIADPCPFLSVIFDPELAVPSAWLPNDTLVGLTVTDWETAGKQIAAAKQAGNNQRNTAVRVIEPHVFSDRLLLGSRRESRRLCFGKQMSRQCNSNPGDVNGSRVQTGATFVLWTKQEKESPKIFICLFLGEHPCGETFCFLDCAGGRQSRANQFASWSTAEMKSGLGFAKSAFSQVRLQQIPDREINSLIPLS